MSSSKNSIPGSVVQQIVKSIRPQWQLATLLIVIALLLAFIGIASQVSPAQAVFCEGPCGEGPTNTPAPTDAPPPPTPESGVRICAISKIVGYQMPDGGEQFYVLDGNGNGVKTAEFSGEAISNLLRQLAGTTLSATVNGQSFTLTNQGDGSFTVDYNGLATRCGPKK